MARKPASAKAPRRAPASVPTEAQAPGARIAIIADVHIGNHAKFGGPVVDGLNARARVTLDTFGRAIDAAKERGCSALFVAGDLFHNRRPEPAVIHAVQRIVHERAQGLPVVIVPGNHDMLDASCTNGNTACAPLWEEATVVTAPRWLHFTTAGASGSLAVLAVPFDGQQSMGKYLEDVVPAMDVATMRSGDAEAVLVTHVGIFREAEAPAWQKRARDGMSAERLLNLQERANIRTAYVGNYHQHETFGLSQRGIVQIGTLNPGGFGDAGTKDRGLMAIHEVGRMVEMVEIPGPRFVVMSKPDELFGVSIGSPDTSYYLRHEAPDPLPEDGPRQGLAGYEHRLPPAARPANDQPVHGLALSEESAIETYADTMTLPTGVDYDKVRELALDCWRRA